MVRDYSIGQLRVKVMAHGSYYSVVVFDGSGIGVTRVYDSRESACRAADEIIGLTTVAEAN